MNISDLATAGASRPTAIPVVGETLRLLSERMGKITQALLLVSGVVRDPYQLFNQVITHATQTLGDVYQIEYTPEHATTAEVSQITIGLRHTIESLNLCHTAGLVSDMNHQIIVTEIRNVEQFIHEKLATYCIGQVAYPFRIPELTDSTNGQGQVSLEQYFTGLAAPERKFAVSDITDKKQESIQPTALRPALEKAPEKETTTPQRSFISTAPKIPLHSDRMDLRIPSPLAIKPISGEDKKERRDAIMKTIRSKGQVTIKDISENIRGCSEKTIQRDLQELIQHGVLIREGEKRWAVYKLAMQNV